MNTVFSYLHVYIGDRLLSRSPSPLSPLLPSVGDGLLFSKSEDSSHVLGYLFLFKGKGIKRTWKL